MNLADTVDALADGSYTVKRSSPSAYVAGRLQAPTVSTFSILASVQPTSGRDLQRLPEGLRVKSVKTIFTSTELKTQGPSQAPDLVVIDADDYEVQTVEEWGAAGGYWKAIALKAGH